jgi:hypothetical protein
MLELQFAQLPLDNNGAIGDVHFDAVGDGNGFFANAGHV